MKRFVFVLLTTASFYASAETQAEINQSAETAFKKAERKMDSAAAAFASGLSYVLVGDLRSTRGIFQSSQTAFKNYRQHHCAISSGIREKDSGSFAKTAYFSCLESMTLTRIAEIEKLSQPCEEGVMDCHSYAN